MTDVISATATNAVPPPAHGHSRCKSMKLCEVYAHSEPITTAAIGPLSCAVFASAADDLRVNVWRIGRNEPLLSLSTGSAPVSALCFDGADTLLCGGGSGGAIKLWDCRTEKLLRSMSGHRSGIGALDFHPYGDFFATGSNDTNVKVWDIRRRGALQTYRGHSAPISRVMHSPDGKWVVSGDTDGAIKVWDLTAAKLIADFVTERAEAVAAITFHPNEFLMSAASAHSIQFIDMETFHVVSRTPREAATIKAAQFSRDGRALLVAQSDGLRVWTWEPTAQCFDAVDVSGWNGLTDIAATDKDEIIGVAKSKTLLTVNIIDTRRLRPFLHAGHNEQENTPQPHMIQPQSLPITPPQTNIISAQDKLSHYSPRAAAVHSTIRPRSPSPPPSASPVMIPPTTQSPLPTFPSPSLSPMSTVTVMPSSSPLPLLSPSAERTPIRQRPNENFFRAHNSAQPQILVSPLPPAPAAPAAPPSLPTWIQNSKEDSVSNLVSPPPPLPPPAPPVADVSAIARRLLSEHSLVSTVLRSRLSQLTIAARSWRGGDVRAVCAELTRSNDTATTADVLSAVSSADRYAFADVLTLDDCELLLPLLRRVLVSRVVQQAETAERVYYALFNRFAPILKHTTTTHNAVDVNADEKRIRAVAVSEEFSMINDIISGGGGGNSGGGRSKSQ